MKFGLYCGQTIRSNCGASTFFAPLSNLRRGWLLAGAYFILREMPMSRDHGFSRVCPSGDSFAGMNPPDLNMLPKGTAGRGLRMAAGWGIFKRRMYGAIFNYS